jgi:hypothetical protein
MFILIATFSCIQIRNGHLCLSWSLIIAIEIYQYTNSDIALVH